MCKAERLMDISADLQRTIINVVVDAIATETSLTNDRKYVMVERIFGKFDALETAEHRAEAGGPGETPLPGGVPTQAGA